MPPKSQVSLAKEVYFILSIAAVVLTVLLCIWGPGGYLEMKRVEAELVVRRARVAAMENSNRERLRTIEALRSNREALERYAREKGYGRQEEIIQQLPQVPPQK